MSSGRTDRELAEAFAAGDESAFEELYDAYSADAFSLAYRLLGNRAEAEDVVQELYLALYRKPRSFRGDCAFTTWQYRVVTNRCNNVFKKRSRRKDRHEKAEELRAIERDDGEGDVRDEMAARVRAAVDELPPAQRQALVLAKYEGIKYEEIAEIVDATPEAVKMRVHRAITTLRTRLGGDTE